MCDICRQNPCHPRCPNASEPRIIFVCDGCGDFIREGDAYYNVDGQYFCQDCVSSKYLDEDEVFELNNCTSPLL